MEKNINRITYENEFFRKNLNYLTKQMGVTKKKMTQDLDINEINLSRLCKHDSTQQPSIETLMRIAKYFNVTIDELIGENIEENRLYKSNGNERKIIRVCKKMIKDTNENLIDWRRYEYNEANDICDEVFEVIPYSTNRLYINDELQIKCNSQDIKVLCASINEANLLMPTLNVCIFKIPFEIENEDSIYEIYVKKEDGDVIKWGASCTAEWFQTELDNELQAIMDELYKVINNYISFGKERFERDRLFDIYLNEGYIPEDMEL